MACRSDISDLRVHGSKQAMMGPSSSSSSFWSPQMIPLAFASLSVFYLLVRILLGERNRTLGLRDYGPRRYPVLGCLVPFYRNKHRLLDWYTELLSVSPTQTIVVSRLGARRTVVTANAANVEHILKSRFDNYPKGRPFSELLGDLLGKGIFNVDGELWHAQRKLASHEFSTRLLRGVVVEAMAVEVDGRLTPILGAAADRGEAVDLQELLRRFAFDTICMISLGTDPACLNQSASEPALAGAFDAAARICASRGTEPVTAVWKFKRALGLGSEKVLREKLAVIQNAVTELINRRKKERVGETAKGHDFLSKLISAGHADDVVRDMVISFIMAGRDTTSSALTWFFWLLSRYPDVEKKLAEEVAQARGVLNYGTLKEMLWLEACLCESMRLYPPVAWDSKYAAEDDVLPDGTPVSAGDRVTYFPYGMGRMESLWGKDAEYFRPRRWLDAEEKEIVKMSPFKYPVFQGGPRVCLGKEMAFIQMKYVAASVLRQFQLRPVSGAEPVFLPLLTSHMGGGLWVKVNKRVVEFDAGARTGS